MPRHPGDRIFGVETEFGCLVADPQLGTPEDVVDALKDHIFYEMRLGAIDLHARDEVFEPARSGGFLLNGGRLYIDAVGSHLEYATAECRSIRDLVANDRAGQRQIVRAIRELGWQGRVSVYNNSVDHFGGHTFGCHENYLARLDEEFFAGNAQLLYPFLVTRQIFAGVGRVGGHVLSSEGLKPSYEDVLQNPVDFIWVSQVYGVHPDSTVAFQLSQRADHILKAVASRVRFNRALINPKWEHFYASDNMQRLHLLFGESNQNEFAYALKVGTTLLVLRLMEDRLVPERLSLAQPLAALRSISRDQSYRWPVRLASGDEISAIDIQREYLRVAGRYSGDSAETDWTLAAWQEILDGLERDPMSLGSKIDWVAKRQIVDQYARDQGLAWSDDALHSVDLEYHNIDPELSLFHAYQDMGSTERFVDEIGIIDAMTEPPANTRAKARARLVADVLKRRGTPFYVFDWNGVALDRRTYVDLSDPFESYS